MLMHTSPRCRSSLTLLLLFVVWAAVPLAATAEPARPNILLVMVDDMGYSDLGCYGGEVRTPTLDALAENGVRLARFQLCSVLPDSCLVSATYINEKGANNEFWKRVVSPATVVDQAPAQAGTTGTKVTS